MSGSAAKSWSSSAIGRPDWLAPHAPLCGAELAEIRGVLRGLRGHVRQGKVRASRHRTAPLLSPEHEMGQSAGAACYMLHAGLLLLLEAGGPLPGLCSDGVRVVSRPIRACWRARCWGARSASDDKAADAGAADRAQGPAAMRWSRGMRCCCRRSPAAQACFMPSMTNWWRTPRPVRCGAVPAAGGLGACAAAGRPCGATARRTLRIRSRADRHGLRDGSDGSRFRPAPGRIHLAAAAVADRVNLNRAKLAVLMALS